LPASAGWLGCHRLEPVVEGPNKIQEPALAGFSQRALAMIKGSNAFHEIFLHLNWHCHLVQPSHGTINEKLEMCGYMDKEIDEEEEDFESK
jgi:hypothetical protein